MAGLLEHPKTDTPEAAERLAQPPVPEVPEPEADADARTCATCSQALVDGQDWCLECGSAQPGRLGGRPGWRAALSVLAVTGVLVSGAGAAAYAALSTEAQRDASAAAPPQAAPLVAAPPVQPAPAPAAAADEPPTIPAPSSDSADVPSPAGDAESDADDSIDLPDTPVTPAPAPAPSGGSTSGSGDESTTDAPTVPVAIDLKSDAAATYNPSKRDAAAIGDPAKAVDGKSSTAWEVPADPSDGSVQTGIVVSLDKATSLSDLEYRLNTPGATIEVYATTSAQLPPDILDSRWEHPASRRDSDVTEKVALDGKFRHVLLWVTEQPADTKVAVADIKLFD
jgi:hypothetical protein